jgi:hypothetical protein
MKKRDNRKGVVRKKVIIFDIYHNNKCYKKIIPDSRKMLCMMSYKKKLTVQWIPNNNNMVPNASFAPSNHYTPFDGLE